MLSTEQSTENRLAHLTIYVLGSPYSFGSNVSFEDEIPNPPVPEASDDVTRNPPSLMRSKPVAAVLLALTSALLFGTFAWIVGAGRTAIAVVVICAVVASVCLVLFAKGFSAAS